MLKSGDMDAVSLVDEDWLLDLERKNFVELLATEKTRGRIEVRESVARVPGITSFILRSGSTAMPDRQ
jgi:hypothetical protein